MSSDSQKKPCSIRLSKEIDGVECKVTEQFTGVGEAVCRNPACRHGRGKPNQELIAEVRTLKLRLEELKKERSELEALNTEYLQTINRQRDMNLKHQTIIMRQETELEKNRADVEAKSKEMIALKSSFSDERILQNTLAGSKEPARVEELVGAFVELNREIYEWKRRALAAERDAEERVAILEKNKALKRALVEKKREQKKMKTTIADLEKKITELQAGCRKCIHRDQHESEEYELSPPTPSQIRKRTILSVVCRVDSNETTETTPKRTRCLEEQLIRRIDDCAI